MTASELIKQLQLVPPDVKVVVRGYEDGYNDVLKLNNLRLKHNTKAEWYYGEYFSSDSQDAISAIELYGENKNE